MGSLAAHCWREKKDRRNGWRAEPRRPPRSGPAPARPILMALLFRPLLRGRINRGICRLAGNWLIVDGNDVGCSALKLMPSCGWPSLAAEVFPSTTRRSMLPALIVGERPMAALRSGRDVSAARPSRSEFLAPRPARAACRKAATTNVDLGLKAAGNGPASALTGLGSCRPMPCSPPSVAHSAPAFQGPDR